MRQRERVLHVAVCCCGTVLLVFGTFAAVKGLAADFKGSAPPFSCGASERASHNSTPNTSHVRQYDLAQKAAGL
jgi:hypothetical protein